MLREDQQIMAFDDGFEIAIEDGPSGVPDHFKQLGLAKEWAAGYHMGLIARRSGGTVLLPEPVVKA